MNPKVLPRIRIEDLPELEALTEKEMAELTGSGRVRLGFDALEQRDLMAGGLSAALSDGVLRIRGTSDADQIRILENSGKLSISQGSLTDPDTQVFDSTFIRRIELDALAGDDEIWLDGGLQYLMPIDVISSAGHDHVHVAGAVFASSAADGINTTHVVAGNTYQVDSEGALTNNGRPLLFAGVALTDVSIQATQTGLQLEGTANLSIIGAVRVRGALDAAGSYNLKSGTLNILESPDGKIRLSNVVVALTPQGIQVQANAQVGTDDRNFERLTFLDAKSGMKDIYVNDALTRREEWTTGTEGGVRVTRTDYAAGSPTARVVYRSGVAVEAASWSASGFVLSTFDNGKETVRKTFQGEDGPLALAESWNDAVYRRETYLIRPSAAGAPSTSTIAKVEVYQLNTSTGKYSPVSAQEISGTGQTNTRFANDQAVERTTLEGSKVVLSETWSMQNGDSVLTAKTFDAAGNVVQTETYRNAVIVERITVRYAGNTPASTTTQTFGADGKYQMVQREATKIQTLSGTWMKSGVSVVVTPSAFSILTASPLKDASGTTKWEETVVERYEMGLLVERIESTWGTHKVQVRVSTGNLRVFATTEVTERYVQSRTATAFRSASGKSETASRTAFAYANSKLVRTKIETWGTNGDYTVAECESNFGNIVKETTVTKLGNISTIQLDSGQRIVSTFGSDKKIDSRITYTGAVRIKIETWSSGVYTVKEYANTSANTLLREIKLINGSVAMMTTWSGIVKTVTNYSGGKTISVFEYVNDAILSIKEWKSDGFYVVTSYANGVCRYRFTYDSHHLTMSEHWTDDGRIIRTEYKSGTMSARYTWSETSGLRISEWWNGPDYQYMRYVDVLKSNFDNSTDYANVLKEWWRDSKYGAVVAPPSFSFKTPAQAKWVSDLKNKGTKFVDTVASGKFAADIKKQFDQAWAGLSGTVQVPTWLSESLGRQMSTASSTAKPLAASSVPAIASAFSTSATPAAIASVPAFQAAKAVIATAANPGAAGLPDIAKVAVAPVIKSIAVSLPASAAASVIQAFSKNPPVMKGITDAGTWIHEKTGNVVDFSKGFGGAASDMWKYISGSTAQAAGSFASATKSLGDKLATEWKKLQKIGIPSELTQALTAFGANADQLAKMPLEMKNQLLIGVSTLNSTDWSKMMVENAPDVGLPVPNALGSLSLESVLAELKQSVHSEAASIFGAELHVKSNGNAFEVSAKSSAFEFQFKFEIESLASPKLKYWEVRAAYANQPFTITYEASSSSKGAIALKAKTGSIDAEATISLTQTDRVATSLNVMYKNGVASGGTTFSSKGTLFLNAARYVPMSVDLEGAGNLLRDLLRNVAGELPLGWSGDAAVSTKYDEASKQWTIFIKASSNVADHKVVAKTTSTNSGTTGTTTVA